MGVNVVERNQTHAKTHTASQVRIIFPYPLYPWYDGLGKGKEPQKHGGLVSIGCCLIFNGNPRGSGHSLTEKPPARCAQAGEEPHVQTHFGSPPALGTHDLQEKRQEDGGWYKTPGLSLKVIDTIKVKYLVTLSQFA